MNNSLKEIAEALKGASKVLIFPHVSPDGDAIGSAAALCRGLRLMGKEAYILVDEELPDNLSFLNERGLESTGKRYCSLDQGILGEDIDVSICVDCGELSRFPKRAETFEKGKLKISVDHHATSKPTFDLNYIDSHAAATGEIMFFLLKELGIKADKEIGEAVFTAINTDTGKFQYANTNKNCHLIMAELYDWGIDARQVSSLVYESVRLEKLRINNAAMESCEILEGKEHKAALAFVSQKQQEEIGVKPSETEEVVDILRSIQGVDIAVFLKEKEAGLIRVSMRAKGWGNVAEIAQKFGGGGHVKAAGCTLYMSLDEAVATMKREVKEVLGKL